MKPAPLNQRIHSNLLGAIRVVIPAFCTWLISPSPAHAAGVVAECTESALLQALVGGGEVTFSCDGIITLGGTIVLTNDTTLNGTGHQVSLSGGSTVRLFSIGPGVHARFKSLTLRDGAHIGADGLGDQVQPVAAEPGRGGAVFNNGGILDLLSCVLSNNVARGGASGGVLEPVYAAEGEGGAIYSLNGQVGIYDSLLSQNQANGGVNPFLSGGRKGAAARGGSLFVMGGTLVLSNSQVVANMALGSNASRPSTEGGAAAGGGIFAMDTTTSISRSLLARNNAYAGRAPEYSTNTVGVGRGGAIFNGGHLTLEDSRICMNETLGGAGEGAGGGIFNADVLKVSRSTFASNTVSGGPGFSFSGFFLTPGYPSYGGAILSRGSMFATNCTFMANVARAGTDVYGRLAANGEGGGIYLEAGVASLNHLTIAANSAQRATILIVGGLFGGVEFITLTNNLAGSAGIKVMSPVTLTLANSLLSGNSEGNVSGTFVDGGYNLSSDASVSLSAAGSLTNVNLKLGPLGMFGGYSEVLPPLPGSPAIDAIPAGLSVSTDQRGVARPFNNKADIGAFEVSGGDNLMGFLNASWADGAPVEIAFAAYPAPAARTVVCDRTTDLQIWTPILTNRLDVSAHFTIQVPPAEAAVPGFYRARISP